MAVSGSRKSWVIVSMSAAAAAPTRFQLCRVVAAEGPTDRDGFAGHTAEDRQAREDNKDGLPARPHSESDGPCPTGVVGPTEVPEEIAECRSVLARDEGDEQASREVPGSTPKRSPAATFAS